MKPESFLRPTLESISGNSFESCHLYKHQLQNYDLIFEWVPSQNGFLLEALHPHQAILLSSVICVSNGLIVVEL